MAICLCCIRLLVGNFRLPSDDVSVSLLLAGFLPPGKCMLFPFVRGYPLLELTHMELLTAHLP